MKQNNNRLKVNLKPGQVLPDKIGVDAFRKLKQANNPFPGKGKSAVQGARRSTSSDGTTFASDLERFTYYQLQAAGIAFHFQHKAELVPVFKYRGKTVLKMEIVVDFYLYELNIYLDPKGYNKFKGAARERSRLKYKWFKYILLGQGLSPRFEFPTTKGEVIDLLQQLKKKDESV